MQRVYTFIDYNFFIITGDFNIHIDNNMDNMVVSLFFVFFLLVNTPEIQISSVSLKKRYINESDSVQFMEAITVSPTMNAETVDIL